MNTRKLVRTLSKNSPTILTALGIAGMWAAAIMLAKSAPVVKEKIETAEEETEMQLPAVVEKAKIALPVVWPALAVGGIATYCLVGANKISLRRNAALAGAYYISQNAFHEYQKKVVEHIGERKEQKVRDDIAKDKLEKTKVEDSKVIITGKGNHLCYIVPFGIYFESDIEKVKQAVLTINERMFNGNELYASVNDFLSELDIPGIGIGDDLGWNIENGQLVATFSSALASDGRPCLTIDFEVSPI